MKSKSFNLKQKKPEQKLNKTDDFAHYYRTAAETSTVLENSKTNESSNVDNKQTLKNKSNSKRSPNKNKLEPLDISLIDIEGPISNPNISKKDILNESKVTSTPQGSRNNQGAKVKSIMKNSSGQGEDITDDTQYVSSPIKPKKRNKSVSFMLEDTEDVVVKKTKSNDSIEKKPSTPKTDVPKQKIKKLKKLKPDLSEKENNVNVNMEIGNQGKLKKGKEEENSNIQLNDIARDIIGDEKKVNLIKKRKLKKIKKQNSDETSETGTESNNNEENIENKCKKLKKKKAKLTQNLGTEGDGEPNTKSSKNNVKPEGIVANLENLSIGDNAHSITNMLDEMTVAGKDKRKRNKRKIKKDKNHTASTSSSENADLEKIDENEEKVKWRKRKWNKDKKGEVDETATSVIVDNLPLSIMCVYKKIISDHFGKHGIIKKIGIAEVYSTEVSKPVFTTTINFYSDGAATKALEEDNTTIEGSRIRVRQQLPPTQTTLVVRSYAELTEQALSTTFLSAGRIRNIRQLIKGKKAIATAFIEFDGPEALEKALKLGQDSKIGGKKIHVSKFEIRKKKKKRKTSVDSENEGDSENSNE
ncbi:unnamed protein product [Diatraea saccharalis]|uniref:RRM domain-containing protein n=1 Tax=Diatraea saccharalis TaxID=40085 RepID=A0A9N9QU59_9NEOP|nr:unnamed protein product [Diatraea saccharalis]